jgi:hypothetical protein
VWRVEVSFRVHDLRFGRKGLGLEVEVEGLGCRVEDLDTMFEVEGLGFRVWGFGFRICGLDPMVWGLGLDLRILVWVQGSWQMVTCRVLRV